MKTSREYALNEIREFAKKNDVYESAILWVAKRLTKVKQTPSWLL
jgi:hypothetical protein